VASVVCIILPNQTFDPVLGTQLFTTLDQGGVNFVLRDLELLTTESLGLEVQYVVDTALANTICSDILESSPSRVGFDLEYTPANQKLPGSDGLVATVQIAMTGKVFVFHLARIDKGERGMPAKLKALLESPDIKKSGVNVASDITLLQKVGVSMPVGCVEDVAQISKRFGITTGNRGASLKTLVEMFEGKTLAKEHACSNWDGAFNATTGVYLRQELINYAALDACAGLIIAEKLDVIRSGIPESFSHGDQVVGYDTSLSTRVFFGKVRLNNEEQAPAGHILIEVNPKEVFSKGFKLLEPQKRFLGVASNGDIKSIGQFIQTLADDTNFFIPWKPPQCLARIHLQPPASQQVMLHDGMRDGVEGGEGQAAAGGSLGQGHGGGAGAGGGGAAQRQGGAEGDVYNGWELETVKLDPVHWFFRIGDLISVTHALRGIFLRALRDAVFVVCQDDKDAWMKMTRESLKGQGLNEREINIRVTKEYDQMLSKSRRSIPSPALLMSSTKKVFDLYGHQVDSKTGKPLFSQDCWAAVKRGQDHIDHGCLSDCPSVELYYSSANDERKNLRCARGTNALEGWHKWLRRLFQGPCFAPVTAMYVLLGRAAVWNDDIDQSHRGGIGHHTRDTQRVCRMKRIDLELGLGENSKYSQTRDPDDWCSTEERFGIIKDGCFTGGVEVLQQQMQADSAGAGGDGAPDDEVSGEAESALAQFLDGSAGESSDEEEEEEAAKLSAAEEEFMQYCNQDRVLKPKCGVMLPKCPTDDEMTLFETLFRVSKDPASIHLGWKKALDMNSALAPSNQKVLRIATQASLENLRTTFETRTNQKESLALFKDAASALQKVNLFVHAR
jgi:hypothetical protein